MTTIKLKNGSGAPTAGDLVQGEPALDLTNKRLYTENASGTVIEVGTNPTSITTGDITATGTVSFANLSTTGDITFGDNDKAIFGAGSDLQIYHDGSNSYVQDSGTGDLWLAGTQVRIANAAGNKTNLYSVDGAQVSIRYNGAEKLATTATGIDVTGSVTADGLTVNSGGDQEVYFGNNTDGIALSNTGVLSKVELGNSQGAGGVAYFEYSRANGSTVFAQGTNGSEVTRMKLANGGDISFYDSAGTSEDLYWDASTSRLGLGITNPAYQLDVTGSSATIRVDNTAGSPDQTLMVFQADMGTNDRNFQIKSPATDSASEPFRFVTGNSFAFEIDANDSALVIDSAANVGIGTSAPATTLELSNNANGQATGDIPTVRLTNSDTTAVATDITGSFEFFSKDASFPDFISGFVRNVAEDAGVNYAVTFGTKSGSSNATERMRIDSSGNVGIGTTSPSVALDVHGSGDTTIRVFSSGTGASDDTIIRSQIAGTTASNYLFFGDTDDNNAGQLRYVHSDDSMRFYAGATTERLRLYSANTIFYNGATEIARFDSSNTLLVGTTNDAPHTTTVAGQGGFAMLDGGMLRLGRNSNPALHVNRITNDGLLAMWYRNGANVGNISVTSSATTYNTSSDQRLKDNIVDAPSASDDIDAIQVRSFDWKADGSHQKYGMVAQELQSVAPEAVTEGDTEEDMMGVDYSKLVPMLVKEIQSLRARVAQLEND